MVQLPEYQQKSNVYPDNPPGLDVNPNNFGGSAAAVARLAGASTDFAFSLLEKRKEASDQDYAFTNAMKDQRDLEEYKQQLQLKMPKDYAGYTDSVNQWVQDRFEQNQQNAPSQTAKELYQRHAEPFLEKSLIDASHQEFQERAKSYVSNIHDDIDQTARLLTSTPLSSFAHDSMSQFKERLDQATGKIIDADTAKQLNDRVKNFLGKGVLDGLYAKGLENPKGGKTFFQQGIDILNGKVAGDKNTGFDFQRNDLADGLLPHEKAAYLDKFARALKEQKRSNLDELHRRFADDIAQTTMGGPSSPTLFRDIDAAVANGDITPEQRVRMYAEHNIADTSRSTIEQMKTTAPTEWMGLARGNEARVDQVNQAFAAKDPTLIAASEPGFMAAERKTYLARIAASGEQMLRERAADPAGYVLKNFPDANLKARMAATSDPAANQDYIQSLLARQRQLGIPDQVQRVTTKDEASQIATNLGGAANEQAAAQQFSLLERKYGPYFSRVFGEMVDDNKIDAKYWVASYVNDPFARQRILANVINSKDIDKAFREKYPAGADQKALTDAVKANADPIVSSIAQQSAGGGSIAKANAMNDVVEQEAKKLMITSGLSTEDAAKKAATVLSTHYGNIQRANSNVTYPRYVGGQPVNPTLLEAFMESHLRKDAFDQMGVASPNDQVKDRFYSDLEQFGRWVPNSGGDGVRLEFQNPVDGRRVPILRKDGSVVEYKFLDITQKADQKTLDQAGKSGLRKWFERTF